MYNISQLKDYLKEKKMDEKFSSIYGGDAYSISEAYNRLSDTIKHFESIEKTQEIYVFSASGRTELSGNHTDHNNGCVLTASINLDKLAVVAKIDDNKIVVYTDYSNNPDIIDINDLNINKDEYGKSNALTRGVCAGIKNKGYNIGGCTVTLNNKVLIGSGLSSSASFESLIGEIQNALYNEDKISKVDIAKIGQYAENVYFGKPCGLMDQMGCSVGGIMSIDFKDNDNPIIEKVEYDFESKGYALMIVDAKGDHSGLTNEYAAIREEMNAVANYFGKKVCREITKKELIDNASKLRAEVGDRAIMRAYHFLEENERVINQINALKNKLPSKVTKQEIMKSFYVTGANLKINDTHISITTTQTDGKKNLDVASQSTPIQVIADDDNGTLLINYNLTSISSPNIPADNVIGSYIYNGFLRTGG